MTASPESMNWIVPYRRLVARETLTYRDVIDAWVEALVEGDAKLTAWYSGAAIATGSSAVRGWARTFFADEADGAHVAREGESTLVAADGAYHVRLWKGPMRVLVEHAAGIDVAPAAEGAGEVAEPPTTEVQHGGPVRLQQSENGEVMNPDATFLMGDVIEFPLHEMLAAAGLGAYANLEFSPRGSFLLGTSVCARGGDNTPPASPLLHDNLAGMRFQLLLDFAVGAFYHLDEDVFVDRTTDVVSATNGGRAVHSRGMIYSASFGRPTTQPRQPRARRGQPAPPPADPIWRLACNQWGVNNLPTRAGYTKLARSFVVSPGWTCSPFTIFLTQYMSNETDNGAYGGNSVRSTMENQSREFALHRVLDTITPAQLQSRVRVDPAVIRTSLQEVKDELDALYARVHGDATLMQEAQTEAHAWAEWAGLPEATKRELDRSFTHPGNLLGWIARRRRNAHATDDEKRTLQRCHQLLVSKAVAFKTRLQTLLHSEAWGRFGQVRPDFSTRPISVVIDHLPDSECAGATCSQRHGLAGIETIDDYLRAKRRNIERVQVSDDAPLGGVSAVTADFTDILGDVNCISLNGHEWGICRIFPHDKLADATELPLRGFIAAYNPLTGNTYFDEPTRRESGQLFVCESGDTLLRWGGNGNLCGAAPHKWRKINGNLLAVEVSGRQTKIGVGQPRSKALLLISSVKRDVLDTAYSQPRKFQPLVIDPVTGDGDVRRRIRDEWWRYYAARAVPTPTLRELDGGFYTHAAVGEAMTRLLASARSGGASADFVAALSGSGAAASAASTTGEADPPSPAAGTTGSTASPTP